MEQGYAAMMNHQFCVNLLIPPEISITLFMLGIIGFVTTFVYSEKPILRTLFVGTSAILIVINGVFFLLWLTACSGMFGANYE